MQQTSVVREGEPVYIRAYSTQRAAIGELIALVHDPDREWGQVRLVTEIYAWDDASEVSEESPKAGEILQVEAYRLEPVRW
jgi:hypothetical protein